jgi:hypothetical protein
MQGLRRWYSTTVRRLVLRSHNATVHRAAANDVDFKTRATRGSVCNGLFVASEIVSSRSVPPRFIEVS